MRERPIVFKIGFISKYLLLEKRENNFIKKIYHENDITYKIFLCTRHLSALHVFSFPHDNNSERILLLK